MHLILTKVFLIFLLLLFVDNVFAAKDERSKRRQATQQALSELQSKIKKIQLNQAKDRSSLTHEQRALKQTDLLISHSRYTLEISQKKLTSIQKRLASLTLEQDQLFRNKKDQQQALAEQIRAAYLGGKQEYLKMLFNQRDPGKFGRTLVYYDYLNKFRMQKIAVLNLTLQKLEKITVQIVTQQQALTHLIAKRQHENNRLTSLKKDRQRAIATLNRSMQSDTLRLKEWRENERDLNSLLEALKQSVAFLIPEESLTGLSALKGKLRWPAKGRLRESFGSQRGDVKIRWSGVLIAAKEGQPVAAIHHGRIVYSDYLRGFGLITIVDHGMGYMSLYGHNEALFKRIGDWVEAGEQIATVGQSGGYPATGLYFEIRLRSKALDPAGFILSN